ATRAPARATGCAARPTRSRAAPAKSSSTSSPSASWACPAPDHEESDMALILNEQQTMLRDSAHAFIAENAPVAHLRQLRDSRDATGYSRAFWKRCADMGFCGVMVPEEHGGM